MKRKQNKINPFEPESFSSEIDWLITSNWRDLKTRTILWKNLPRGFRKKDYKKVGSVQEKRAPRLSKEVFTKETTVHSKNGQKNLVRKEKPKEGNFPWPIAATDFVT